MCTHRMNTQPRLVARHVMLLVWNKHHSKRNMKVAVFAFASTLSTWHNMFRMILLESNLPKCCPLQLQLMLILPCPCTPVRMHMQALVYRLQLGSCLLQSPAFKHLLMPPAITSGYLFFGFCVYLCNCDGCLYTHLIPCQVGCMYL